MYLSMYGCRNDINLHKIEKQLYNYEHIKTWKQNKIKRMYQSILYTKSKECTFIENGGY